MGARGRCNGIIRSRVAPESTFHWLRWSTERRPGDWDGTDLRRITGANLPPRDLASVYARGAFAAKADFDGADLREA